MADQDIFFELELPPDSNFAQALDALACVSLLLAGVDVFVRPSLAAVGLLVFAAVGAAVAYFIRWWKIDKAVPSVREDMNGEYQVTTERLKMLHSQIDPGVFAAVKTLGRQPMNGVDLVVHRLGLVVPHEDLLRAMRVLLSTLKGSVPPPSSSPGAAPPVIPAP